MKIPKPPKLGRLELDKITSLVHKRFLDEHPRNGPRGMISKFWFEEVWKFLVKMGFIKDGR